MGYIYAVMVKDLSRLGRDYVSVGNYTDVYFPDHDIRFIAVNDGIDSEEGESEIAPFKNVMNEMYARDISKKIRSSHRLRGSMGEPLSQPPYGYMKSAENKKKWVIDQEAADVNGTIFHRLPEEVLPTQTPQKKNPNRTTKRKKIRSLRLPRKPKALK